MENLTAADVAAVTRGNYADGDGFGFGNGGIWLFAILALMWGRNGFGGADGRCATVEDLNNSANFTRLESQVQNNGNAIQSTATNLYNGICNLGYETSQNFGALSKEVAECCCGINRNIDGVRYENAINTAAINANTNAGIQKVLDRLCADKEQALYSRINQLEMQQNLCGIIRYPTQATYNAGFPFNNCGVCNNI
jgi:hypothetical protein